MMKRATLNRLIDAFAFAGFLVLVSTGLLLRVLLPPGSGRLYGTGTGYRAAEQPVALLWGLTRHGWGNLHFWVAFGLMLVLAIHVALHWRWIVCSIQGRPREGSGIRLGLGILGLVTVLIIAIAPGESSTAYVPRSQLSGSTESARSAPDQESMSPHARGMMTLQDIEDITGVPVSYVTEQLGLPGDISPDDRLGRLRRLYGFTLHDVRRIVTTYNRQRPNR